MEHKSGQAAHHEIKYFGVRIDVVPDKPMNNPLIDGIHAEVTETTFCRTCGVSDIEIMYQMDIKPELKMPTDRMDLPDFAAWAARAASTAIHQALFELTETGLAASLPVLPNEV